MNLYNIIRTPKKEFERIKEDNDISQPRINIYIICLGIIITLYVWFMKYDSSIVAIKDNDVPTSILVIILLVLSSVLSFILFKAISWMIFWIGKVLNGKAEVKQVQIIILYTTLFAILVTIPLQIIFKLTSEIEFFIRINSFFISTLNIVVFLIATRISIIGLSVFNKYSYTRGIVNYSPFIILIIFQFYSQY